MFSWVCSTRVPILPHVTVRSGPFLQCYTQETRDISDLEFSSPLCLLLQPSFYSCATLGFHISEIACMVIMESMPPKPRPPRSWTGRWLIIFFGSVSAHLRSRSSSPAYNNNTLADINNKDLAMVAFQGPTYALLLSLLALVLAQYADMLSVFSLMHGVKFATGYVMLISVLKFTRKLLNNLTDRS
jgi:hypothetical protein